MQWEHNCTSWCNTTQSDIREIKNAIYTRKWSTDCRVRKSQLKDLVARLLAGFRTYTIIIKLQNTSILMAWVVRLLYSSIQTFSNDVLSALTLWTCRTRTGRLLVEWYYMLLVWAILLTTYRHNSNHPHTAYMSKYTFLDWNNTIIVISIHN